MWEAEKIARVNYHHESVDLKEGNFKCCGKNGVITESGANWLVHTVSQQLLK